MADENVCSVCWDTFKFPKLLPCKHTFCASCLHEFLDGSEDKSNLVCPLCREPCYVPRTGFSDFLTNYFVPVEKIEKLCQKCKTGAISKICYVCNATLCLTCVFAHAHTKKTKKRDDNDSDTESVPGLSFHLRWQLMQQGMKTEFLCQQVSEFVPEFSPPENERISIRSMACSQKGGVYVNRSGNTNLLRYNEQGVVVDRTPLLAEAATILETRSGLLLIAHFVLKTTVCYNDGRPNFRHFHFAQTPSFHPIALSELRNGDIVICGPVQLLDKDTEVAKNNYGIIRIYTQQRRLLREIGDNESDKILKFPTQIACSNKFDIIAVCDTGHNKILFLDYEGKLQTSYQGWRRMPFLLFSELDVFRPSSVCLTQDGNFIVAEIHRECLHVLDPHGKLIGILRCENGEGLLETNTVCVDVKNNIWVGHYSQGIVTVLKLSLFKNIFERFDLPFLPDFRQDLDLSSLPGLNDHM